MDLSKSTEKSHHVQITAAETLGIGSRGRYYDTAGALRDMVPNHWFQLVSLTAMEPSVSFDADAVRYEQVKVLDATHDRGGLARDQADSGCLEGAARARRTRVEANRNRAISRSCIG